MAFHGLMLVRDEADILPQTLDHLLTWIDTLHVLDLGSTDQTWEIVQDRARSDKRVVPFLSRPIVYNDGLRCMLFDQFRDRFTPGDWVLKIDADEFYEMPPPQFVKDCMRAGETAVYLLWYFFRLTTTEVEAYESGRVDLHEDRKRAIQLRRRLYKIADYSEPRMFRYRRSMQWPHFITAPYNAGFVARERIPIRHYPHRDPLQMQQRYRLRAAMVKLKGAAAGPHWNLEDWRRDVLRVGPGGEIIEQSAPGEGLSAAAGHTAGELLEWIPGSALPRVSGTGHLQPWPKRGIQRLIHPLLLPLLDRTRMAYAGDYQPAEIPAEITEQLRAQTRLAGIPLAGGGTTG